MASDQWPDKTQSLISAARRGRIGNDASRAGCPRSQESQAADSQKQKAHQTTQPHPPARGKKKMSNWAPQTSRSRCLCRGDRPGRPFGYRVAISLDSTEIRSRRAAETYGGPRPARARCRRTRAQHAERHTVSPPGFFPENHRFSWGRSGNRRFPSECRVKP